MSKLKADYHLHSKHSPDSDTAMEKQIQRATRLGLAEICFTDHAEFDPYWGGDWTLNFEEYEREILSLRERYPQIKIKMGYEFGLADYPQSLDTARRQIPPLRFDFVLASVHLVGQLSVFERDYYRGRSYAQSCESYLRTVYEMIARLEPHEYSAVGHIDCPAKLPAAVHGSTDARIKLSYFGDVFDHFARHLIERGKTFELNTSSWRCLGDGQSHGLDWLRRFRELGGEFICFGSDAHREENLAYRFDEAAEMATAAGIRYYATYDGMEATLLPIG